MVVTTWILGETNKVFWRNILDILKVKKKIENNKLLFENLAIELPINTM